jgi:hypothetical protein
VIPELILFDLELPSRSRRDGSFSRHRRSSFRIDAGVSAGNAAQSGSRVTTDAMTSVMVSPGNAARPVSIS